MNRNLSVCAVHGKNGAYLLAKRKPGGSQGGKWEFPGGKVESEELPPEALVREIAEELGLECRVIREIAQTQFVHKEKVYTLLAYGVELNSLDFVLSEHEEAGWFSPEEIRSMDLSESDWKIFQQLVS